MDQTRTYSLTSVTDGNGCTGTDTGSATITVKPPVPLAVSALALSATTVKVTWSFTGVADSFEIEQRAANGTINVVAPAAARELTLNVTANTAYVYRVRSKKGTTFSDYSLPDLTTTVIFVDDPLVPEVSVVKAVHMTQLRTAVAAVRALTTSTPAVFTDPTPVIVRQVHITELRTMLNQARVALGLPPWIFADDPFATPEIVKAVHFNDLRGGVR